MDPGEDDLIILSGDGHITQWQFPKQLTYCPVLSCRIQFRNRSEAIAHYKERHAMNAILCSLCNKPIRTDTKNSSKEFISHYRRMHPDAELPIDFEETSKPLEQNDSKMREVCTVRARKTFDSIFFRLHIFVFILKIHQFQNVDLSPQIERKNDKDNDLITLGGCGRITQWRYPNNLMQCPNVKCCKEFETRSNAIAHFKELHAKDAILCSICQKPIAAQYESVFIRHWERKHPQMKMPYGFGTAPNQTKQV